MALNLIRNSRVFFTTNVNSDGKVLTTGLLPANTFEIQVQDGFSFSQNTTQETVTLNEAGDAPVRGQRSFNTSLEPVDWSFSTYIRPKFEEGTVINASPDADDFVTCEESVLWNALASPVATSDIGQANAAWVQTVGLTPVSTLTFAKSNTHQLKRFGLIIVFEAVTYVINNCALESASVDFGIDAISSIAWAGKGTTMEQVLTGVTIADVSATRISTFSGGLTGTARFKDVNAKYIANKLSTMTVARTLFPGQTAATYNIALTGGNITIANNLTYLTPANLGVVNAPVTYFTGTRAITASVNAYLKTGTNESSTLLRDMLASSAVDDENQFSVTVSLGGATNSNKVVLEMPTSMLGIPTITSEQVISTTINIMPQAGAVAGYDIEGTNELAVKYYAVA
jgi:hypothetical protein